MEKAFRVQSLLFIDDSTVEGDNTSRSHYRHHERKRVARSRSFGAVIAALGVWRPASRTLRVGLGRYMLLLSSWTVREGEGRMTRRPGDACVVWLFRCLREEAWPKAWYITRGCDSVLEGHCRLHAVSREMRAFVSSTLLPCG